MKPKTSAGLLMYKKWEGRLMVFIGHPGGPFWKGKDNGTWSIPKGEVNEGEDLLSTAKREFYEEIGIKVDDGKEFIELGNIVQKSGKVVYAWAFEGDWSGLLMGKSFVEAEYNGKKSIFPEIDKAGFFDVNEVKKRLNEAQFEFVNRLSEKLNCAKK